MSKFGVKEVMDVTLYSTTTGKPVLFLDTLKMTNLENTAEQASAKGGKGNPKLLTWDFNRESTIKIQDALLSNKSLALRTGNALSTGAVAIHKREVLTVNSSNKVTCSETPIVGAANTLFVYLFTDGDDGTEQTAGTPATTANTYSVGGTPARELTFNATSCPEGTEVVCYYKYTSAETAQTVTITSDSFPGYYKLVGDTVVRDNETGTDVGYQVIVEKCKVKPGFSMTFQADGDPSVFDMDIEVFREDANTNMVKMIKY